MLYIHTSISAMFSYILFAFTGSCSSFNESDHTGSWIEEIQKTVDNKFLYNLQQKNLTVLSDLRQCNNYSNLADKPYS